MIALDEIVLQKAVEEYKKLYQRLKSSGMTVQEFETAKWGIFGQCLN